MKKVLALVLTLAMLVSSMAVGLSAAFEFTATENGDKFENVYSVPLGSGKAAKVTYLQIDNCSSANRNFALDLWFTGESGFIGTNYGSGVRPWITISEIGLLVNNEKHILTYNFEVGQKYEIAIRTGGAEEGKTNIIVNGNTIGAVDGQIVEGLLYTGASGVIMDNIKMTDGNDTQFARDFDGTETGSGSATGDEVTEFEFRRDLGKYYGSGSGSYTQLDLENWRQDANNFRISFDISFMSAEQSLRTWSGHGLYVSPSKIGVGDPDRDGTVVDHELNLNEWYFVEYVVADGVTSIYVDGVKVEGTFNNLGASGYVTDSYILMWPACRMDNIKCGTADVKTFEEPDSEFVDFTRAEHVGEKVDIFEKISTYPVEGEATLIEAARNADKDPSRDDNALYMTTEHTDGAVPKEYIVNFDLALYPDKEGDISSDKTTNGSWVEFIVNKFQNGNDSRLKIGNKFVGKNKDLVYYGEENEFKAWEAGEFHNVAIQIANGAATVYVDKQEVYTSPVGMDNWDNIFILYVDNASAIIDNYRVYDAKTFEVKVDTLKINDGSDYVKTISDVKAENFCETNGHICSWSRKLDPKCYENGTNTYKCWICGATEDKDEVAKLEHEFVDYDINRVNDEGLVYTYCKTSDGCTERRYVQLPDAEAYTGNIKFFHDFQDDFIVETSSVIGFDKIEDGVAKYTESDANYNQIGLGRDYSGSELNAGIKMGFDFSVDGTFDTNASLGAYGHSFDILFGKSIVGAATIKYNMDTQKFYINSTNKNFIEVATEKTYPLVLGEVYHMEIAYSVNEDDMVAELAVYFNGEEVLRMDEMDAYDYIPYDEDATIDCILAHVFGVKINIDNFVIGDYDFSWNRTYGGDVDGDYEVTVNDALLMRKYLAKIVDMDALYASRADVNGDGYIDAIDQLRIRKMLAD